MKTTDARKRAIARSMQDLVESYAKAMRQLEHSLATFTRELEIEEITIPGPTTRQAALNMPIADRTTLSVVWRGSSCFLGKTLPFDLIEKLLSWPNRYYSHEDLMEYVWKGPRSVAAVKSVVKVLKQKLVAGGMREIANAIDGRTGHYGFMLDRLK